MKLSFNSLHFQIIVNISAHSSWISVCVRCVCAHSFAIHSKNPKIKLKHFLANFVRPRDIFFSSSFYCIVSHCIGSIRWLGLASHRFVQLVMDAIFCCFFFSAVQIVTMYPSTAPLSIASATQNISHEKTYDDLRRKFEGYAVNNSWHVFHFRLHCVRASERSACNFFFYFFSQFWSECVGVPCYDKWMRQWFCGVCVFANARESCKNKESLLMFLRNFGANRYLNREENEPNKFSIKWTANKRRYKQSENWLIEGGLGASDVRWSDKKEKLNAKYSLYTYLLSERKAWATIRTSIFGRSFSIGRRCHGISFLLFEPSYKVAQQFNRFGFRLNARKFHWIREFVCVCAFRVDYRAHDFSRTSAEMRHKMERIGKGEKDWMKPDINVGGEDKVPRNYPRMYWKRRVAFHVPSLAI